MAPVSVKRSIITCLCHVMWLNSNSIFLRAYSLGMESTICLCARMLVLEWKKKELLYRKTELQNGTPIWRLHAMLYKGAWNISANNSETVGHKDLGLGQLKVSSCPILPHCYGPLRAVNGPYVLHKPSLLLTVRMLSTYGACISLLHEGTMRYGSFDPYGPKTYGACISLLHQGTMRYGSFDPYSP